MDVISFPDFAKIDLRAGKILDAKEVENSGKLIRLRVSFGGVEKTVFTGLKKYFDPSFFQDKLFVFVYNLEPRSMMGEMSEGMLLATDTESGPKPLQAPDGSKEGERIK